MATKSLALFVFLSVLAAVCLCDKLPWKVCPSSTGSASVLNVTVNASVSDNMVQLKKGTSVSVTVQFKMTEGSANGITAVVHGILGGIPVPFPLNNPNACKGCGLKCPVSAPNQYTYTSVIAVKSEYPSVRVVVKWELTDQNKKDLWCIELPAQIS